MRTSRREHPVSSSVKRTYRARRVVVAPSGELHQLFDGTYEVALAFARESWGAGTKIVPWLLTSDAMRAVAAEKPAISCVAAGGKVGDCAQVRKMGAGDAS